MMSAFSTSQCYSTSCCTCAQLPIFIGNSSSSVIEFDELRATSWMEPKILITSSCMIHCS
ncbi:hypothetical protein DCAR_0729918 [Daucus carota subsp. sativus]|uniref:Uncharacterized protein n=1 Tax=Daucus carota subsp. sativus TaxID=79200 RepID=A0A161X8U7_DAUCS|nr:hypothetical protein DCAR_0729918 [Daucus carota subsp. sativus]